MLKKVKTSVTLYIHKQNHSEGFFISTVSMEEHGFPLVDKKTIEVSHNAEVTPALQAEKLVELAQAKDKEADELTCQADALREEAKELRGQA
jgi:hypothetical protein